MRRTAFDKRLGRYIVYEDDKPIATYSHYTAAMLHIATGEYQPDRKVTLRKFLGITRDRQQFR